MQRSYIDYAMSVIVGRALPEVRDGLKPVHRRVLYAMYDQGFRPDRGYVKCARVVGEVMGNYHPHGDSAIYDALVRLAQPWSMRYPLIDGQGNFGSPGNDPAAAMRYTEARLTPLAMEMLADIDEDTVDFQPNYDGKNSEPLVLPGRIPNLLINGSAGIAVGMATNMPPHNLREVAAAVFWMLEHPDAEPEEALNACMQRIPGPDFPTHGLIVGREGIEEAYRTGRGSVRMRAVVTVEEDARGRVQLVCTELPYQVNPDNLAEAIADAVKDGRLQGISEIADESSDRVGRRLVITLRRDAVAKVVLNNLYKYTQLQTTFSCAGSRPWSASGSSTSWPRSRPASPTCRRSSTRRSASGRSSATSCARSSTSTATTGAPSSWPTRATSPWRTSSRRRRSSSPSPAPATPSGPRATSTGRSGAAARASWV